MRSDNPVIVARRALPVATRCKRLYDDDNNFISDVGRKQMETLGRFFGGEYAQLLGNESVRWESSPAERCEESGQAVPEGVFRGIVMSSPIKTDRRQSTDGHVQGLGPDRHACFASVQGLKSGEPRGPTRCERGAGDGRWRTCTRIERRPYGSPRFLTTLLELLFTLPGRGRGL